MTEFTGSPEEFKKTLATGNTVIVFGAEWCGPCKSLNPVIEKLASLMPGVRFLHVDVDTNEGIANDIESIPHIRVYRDGEECDRRTGGASAGVLRTWINQALED